LQGSGLSPALVYKQSFALLPSLAFAGNKAGDKAGNNRTLKQFSYSRLILALFTPILCEAYLNTQHLAKNELSVAIFKSNHQ